ncbi:SMP-30/gluconolactonase/LRE family protein [Paenibacillus sp. LMG 31461]|uniref:SMP-30/gluconolactonase/LRE family protein n=1 Tax=Paenibacillus plantarum TaxID=2654975 RepID=A0ABX1XHM3_9BACL|nr:SMP-30/gluconolactonase/LRE family protein [Paenibacillus plantarum]NOU67369.1 SMP-30/gluconolactonase/LRE family protein [Paenibacillus plantarum]
MGIYSSQVFTKPFGFTQGIEGPACDRQGNLYAVNYERNHTVGLITPEGHGSVFIELPNGSIGNGIRFNLQGDMFIADYVNHIIYRVDMPTRKLSIHAHEPKMNQPNDIAISDRGVIFASDPNWGESTGNMWRIDATGEVTLLESNMGTTNGIEVSPDGKKLYVNETVQRNIWSYDLNDSSDVSNKQLLHHFPDYGLDGMRCDSMGNLYVTRYGKGTIAKISPEGELLLEITLHAKNCTNLTFGGNDGRTCYVTMADEGNVEWFQTDIPGRCWTMWRLGDSLQQIR